jgi:hypothetical protein
MSAEKFDITEAASRMKLHKEGSLIHTTGEVLAKATDHEPLIEDISADPLEDIPIDHFIGFDYLGSYTRDINERLVVAHNHDYVQIFFSLDGKIYLFYELRRYDPANLSQYMDQKEIRGENHIFGLEIDLNKENLRANPVGLREIEGVGSTLYSIEPMDLPQEAALGYIARMQNIMDNGNLQTFGGQQV